MSTGSRKFDISETENAVIHFKLKLFIRKMRNEFFKI